MHAGKGEGWLGGLIGRAEWKRENDREMKTTMIRRRAAVSDQPGGVGWGEGGGGCLGTTERG